MGALRGQDSLVESNLMPLSPAKPTDHLAAHRMERRSQLRGLLILATLILLWILARADRHAIFHPNWWRL